MIEVFLVVPEATNVRQFRALPGWRVFMTLGGALNDLEHRYKDRSRRYGSFARGSDAIPIVGTVPENLYEKCWCTLGDPCDHHTFLLIDAVNVDEPTLKKPLSYWHRVTQERVVAAEIQDRLLGREPQKWLFRKHWFPLLPASDPPPEPVIMRK